MVKIILDASLTSRGAYRGKGAKLNVRAGLAKNLSANGRAHAPKTDVEKAGDFEDFPPAKPAPETTTEPTPEPEPKPETKPAAEKKPAAPKAGADRAGAPAPEPKLDAPAAPAKAEDGDKGDKDAES